MESRIIKLNSRDLRRALQVVPQLTAALNEKRPFRLLSYSGPSCARWLADGAMLQAMNESFPQWPSLFCYFVLPSGPKHLLLNLWITDSQATTPMEMVEQLDLEYRLILQNMSRIGVWIASGLRQSATRILPPSEDHLYTRSASEIASNFCSLIPIRTLRDHIHVDCMQYYSGLSLQSEPK